MKNNKFQASPLTALLLFLFVFFCFSIEARIYIPIDQPSDKKMPEAIKPLLPWEAKGDPKLEKEISEIIQKDLEMTGYFEFIPPMAFLEPEGQIGLSTDTINFDHWTAIEVQALIKGSIERNGNEIGLQLKLFDPFLKTLLVGKQYNGNPKEIRTMAHRFA